MKREGGKFLRSVADEEVNGVLSRLPQVLREKAETVPISYDCRDWTTLRDEGLGDTLGLFVGENFVESGHTGGLPAQIILYLENLWWEGDEDEALYRKEIRATLLHEFGHYLGLEEIDLEERGL